MGRALSAPYYVNLEPTNHCNLRCPICSRANGTPRGYMSWEVFTAIVDQCASLGVRHVSLFLGGEPTLHPGLPRMVAYVEKLGMVSGLHTNASVLTREKSGELLEAGLSQISISFDGETAEEYERMRTGARYQETRSNILTFLETKKSLGLTRPHTIIQTVRPFRREMQDEMGWIHYPAPGEEFSRQFQGLPVDEIRVLLPHTWRGEKTDIAHRPAGSTYFRCKHLWMGLSIAWDGQAVGCCNDLNRAHPRGSALGGGLGRVWDGPDARRLRYLHARREHRLIPLCSACHEVWRDEHPVRSWMRAAPILGVLRKLARARGRRLRAEGQRP